MVLIHRRLSFPTRSPETLINTLVKENWITKKKKNKSERVKW